MVWYVEKVKIGKWSLIICNGMEWMPANNALRKGC